MRIIKPLTVTEATLTASNVPINDAPAWVEATNYVTGDKVVRGTHLWEALRGNVGVTPSSAAVDDWLDLGAVNRWKMFARSVGNATVSDVAIPAVNAVEDEDALAGIAVTVTPGVLFNAVALLDIEGLFADVIVEDDGVRVYEKRVSLSSLLPESNWYWYFNSPITRVRELGFFDLPSISGTLRVAVHEPSTPAKLGVLVLGERQELGKAIHGARLGIQDFSRKTRDDFGNIDVVERAFARRAEVDVFFPFTAATSVHRLLTDIRAQPVVWEVSDMVGASLIYGFWREFGVVLSGPTMVTASIEIEGLT